jgi:hypothetical protein
MTGHRRPGLALIVGLCLWIPSARALLSGDIDLNHAALRLLVSLGISWVGFTVLGWVTAGYGRHRHAPPERAARRSRSRPRATTEPGPAQS